jgi:hypothetical protein
VGAAASRAGDPAWRFHAQPMGSGGSQMFAYDVNGDGLNDIITALIRARVRPRVRGEQIARSRSSSASTS